MPRRKHSPEVRALMTISLALRAMDSRHARAAFLRWALEANDAGVFDRPAAPDGLAFDRTAFARVTDTLPLPPTTETP
jgi:hypothetical protein